MTSIKASLDRMPPRRGWRPTKAPDTARERGKDEWEELLSVTPTPVPASDSTSIGDAVPYRARTPVLVPHGLCKTYGSGEPLVYALRDMDLDSQSGASRLFIVSLPAEYAQATRLGAMPRIPQEHRCNLSIGSSCARFVQQGWALDPSLIELPLSAAGEQVVDRSGILLRYGKAEASFRHAGFIASGGLRVPWDKDALLPMPCAGESRP